MTEITFKQSKSWWQSKDLNWFIENADFAFTNNGYKGNRVRIVTKGHTGVNDRNNCFEFDNDRYGIMITSETVFSKGLEESIVERTTDVIPMLIKFLNEWGAGEFINPKVNLSHIINTIKKNHKLITIKK
jgi:hypothetical protein